MRTGLVFPAWTAVFFLAFFAALGCSIFSSGDDDDDDDDDADNPDDDFGSDDDDGDIKERCIEFYTECYGIDAAAAETYCSFIDDYEGLGACYDTAVEDYLTCIFENFDCGTHNADTIQDCVDDFNQALTDCAAADDDAGDDDADDDNADDTSIDDDTGDDDTGAPVLSDGGWDPPSFTWIASCETDPCSTLTWSVCDVENNMQPDGVFYIYQAGTSNAFFVNGPGMPITGWTFPTTPDFSDCAHPVSLGIGMLLPASVFPSPGAYEFSCDIEATDNDGNLSNKLTDLTVQITYNG